MSPKRALKREADPRTPLVSKTMVLASAPKAVNVVAKVPKPPSEGEEAFAQFLDLAKIKYVRQYKFHPMRKWTVDFYFYNGVCVEIEGGTYSGGRHSFGQGFEEDCEKYNELTSMGHKLYRFTTKTAKNGEAVAWLLEKKAVPYGTA